ncbi:glycosyltransferase family 2 protein [Streptomonospora sp. PA3]|uniref:glycosyltransferase family 2 protein n=1 Tax=Streptomonospora sp. PA3 TaxID=2607326 RepID=UPI0012DEF7F8|nr:glycosyltransferase family 2 protein [Streptomonospora sp. PA3]MUL39987.1 glycosyltransferase family 2 protein [Streptomonospora sp. PA3]
MEIAVSVVVPAYNTSRGILRGLDSLRRQTMPRERFEVIYVDDGSTDGTGELLDSELAGEPNFSVVHIENSGWPGRPRNIGVERARGQYVFFMDDDDRLGPEALERLYAKAVQDEADIVIGRMAGVGRNAPREVFQRPMSNGSLRTRPVLLSTLTVQKLFRRAFLLENGISFPDGKVRLEDHMFMLRAYLATDRVSVVHDYTCYYWVRNKGFGNISYSRKEPAEFLGSIEQIFDIIDEHVEPGAFRDRLIAHWLRSKLLGLFQGGKFLRQDHERTAMMHELAGDLVRRRVPEQAVARLNAFSRLRAAALTADDPRLLRPVAEFEEDIAHRTRITGFSWEGAALVVDTETTLEHASTGAPLEFRREGDSVYWDLPDELLAVPAIKEAAEISGEVDKVVCRAFASRSGDPAVVRLPLDVEAHQEPAETPGRFRLRLSGRMRVDADGGDHGHPLTGTWWFSTRVVIGGIGHNTMLGPDRTREAERTRTPAFVGTADAPRFANPYWNADGLLTLSTVGSWRPLRRAVRTGLAPTVSRTAAGLRVEIPLAVHAAAPGTLMLVCTGEGREPLSASARVYAAPRRPDGTALPTAVLSATLPMPSGHGGVLHIGVGEGDAHTRLGLDLYRTPLGWRIGRPEGPLARRCARACVRKARRTARRMPRPVRRAYVGVKQALRTAGRGRSAPEPAAATAAASSGAPVPSTAAERTVEAPPVRTAPRVGAGVGSGAGTPAREKRALADGSRRSG